MFRRVPGVIAGAILHTDGTDSTVRGRNSALQLRRALPVHPATVGTAQDRSSSRLCRNRSAGSPKAVYSVRGIDDHHAMSMVNRIRLSRSPSLVRRLSFALSRPPSLSFSPSLSFALSRRLSLSLSLVFTVSLVRAVSPSLVRRLSRSPSRHLATSPRRRQNHGLPR